MNNDLIKRLRKKSEGRYYRDLLAEAADALQNSDSELESEISGYIQQNLRYIKWIEELQAKVDSLEKNGHPNDSKSA